MKKLIASSLFLAAGFLFASAVAAQDLTVAVAGPMTGREAVFGRQMKDGAELAVADINAAGGVLGKKLKLEVGDDQCDPKQARSIAEKFASSKLPFVAGHYCSSSSIPASEAYAEGNVLQITPASTNPTFTERGLWNTFRVCGRDDQQGAVAGEYLAKTFANKNIAILNDKTTYGKGLADETKKALNKAGVQEKVFESYNKGESDFNALVSKMKAANIEAVFVGGYHQEAGLILRQMRDQGMKTVLMAGDALADKEFAAITGAAGEGTLMTFGSDPRKRPTAAAIVDRFKAEGHRSRRLHALQLCRLPDLGAGGNASRHHRSEKSRRDHSCGQLEHGARADLLRQEGRHHHARLRHLCLEKGRHLFRDVTAPDPRRSSPPSGGLFLCSSAEAREHRKTFQEPVARLRDPAAEESEARKHEQAAHDLLHATEVRAHAGKEADEGFQREGGEEKRNSQARANRPRAAPRRARPSPRRRRPRGSPPAPDRCRASSQRRRQGPSRRRPKGRPAFRHACAPCARGKEGGRRRENAAPSR